MVDQVLSQQNEEYEALVSSVQDYADLEQQQQQQTTISNYGSDEEDYDQLFMELMSRQEVVERSPSTMEDNAPEQGMDLSAG